MSYIKPNLTLRDFQTEAVGFLLEKPRAVVAIPTGCGKTIISFTTYAKLKEKNPKLKLIYVTEKPLIKQTISQDLPTYFNFSFTHIYNNTKQERIAKYKAWVKLHDILIINYSSLRIDFNALGEILANTGTEMVSIFDEATNFRNSEAQITKCVRALARASKNSYAMTATPASRGLYDVLSIMTTMGVAPYQNKIIFNKIHAVFSAKKMFLFRLGDKSAMGVGMPYENRKDAQVCYMSLKKRFKLDGIVKILTIPKTGIFQILDNNKGTFSWAIYNEVYTRCNLLVMNGDKKLAITAQVFNETQHTGYKNLKTFREKTKGVMFVKAKREIVKELPPVTVSVRYCDEDAKSIEAVKEIYKDEKHSASQIEIAQATPQAYLEIDPLYKTDKIQRIVDFIKYDIQNDKCIIYFPYTTTTAILKNILERELGQKVAYCYGGNKDNNAELLEFLNNKDIQVLIGTNTILKGLNIQAVNHIIMMQPTYIGESFIQLVGRINRIGGDYNPKFVTYFLCDETRDIDIYKALNAQLKHIHDIDPKLLEDGLLPQETDSMTEEQAKDYLDKQLEGRKTQYL